MTAVGLVVQHPDGGACSGGVTLHCCELRIGPLVQRPLLNCYSERLNGGGAAHNQRRRGDRFVERIEGDHGTVVGLSLPLLRTMTAELGVPWNSLWVLGDQLSH